MSPAPRRRGSDPWGSGRWTLIVVCTSTAVLLVNVAAPNVALEAIAGDLDASFTDLQWVLSGYSLVLAVFQLTAGSLADLFGRRRLFAIGLCLFIAGSALCALASSAGLLIAARAVQGLGAAVTFPASLALLAQEFEGAARGRAIGVWGATIGLAFAAGPLVGGVLVSVFGWQAIFALGVVLGLPTLALALTKVGESRDPDPRPVDWPGVATLSLGLFLIVFAVLRGNALGWTSTPVLALLAAGALALAAFARVELRATDPMLDLRLFRNRTFLGATVIVATLAGGAFGVFVYLALFLLDVRGGTPVEVGLWLAPLALVAFAVSLGAGRLSGRVPLTGALALGMGLTAAGLLMMLGVDADSSWLHLLAGLVVAGAGTGLANPLVTFAHLGVLPPAQGGLASGINNTARQLGLAVGIAVLGALLQSRIADGTAEGSSYAAAFASGLNALLLVAVALALAGLAAALVLVRPRDLWQSA
jgi:EmrB/QacA subfamily drug resistance transporter